MYPTNIFQIPILSNSVKRNILLKNSNWTEELWPHGKRINMGAYGGTSQASMSLSNAGNIADLNNDNRVNYTDLMMFARSWLCEKALLREDFDRNGFVNFTDFAIFANNWVWEE